MNGIEGTIQALRAQERALFNEEILPDKRRMLDEIDRQGYFTAGLRPEDPLDTPFLLLMHPLPSGNDDVMYHNHNCFELVYVYRGTCRNLMRDYQVTLLQGDLLLMNPLTVHCLCADGEDAVIFNLLIPEHTVDQSFLTMLSDNPVSNFFVDYLHHIRTGPNFLIVTRSQSDPLEALLQRIIVEYREKLPGHNAILQTGLVQVFVYMARRCGESIRAFPLQKTSPLVRSLILYVTENVATATLADAARALSYHEKHLSRQMKKELGMGFNQFLRYQRLRIAAQLLARTDMPVAQVAREVGYQNISHFYGLFEQAHAMTPAAWRLANHAR